MFVKTFQNDRYLSSYIKFVADTIEDVKRIKITPAQMGSEVYVIENKKTYILDSKKTWHSKKDDDDDSIECDCVEELTIWDEIPENK